MNPILFHKELLSSKTDLSIAKKLKIRRKTNFTLTLSVHISCENEQKSSQTLSEALFLSERHAFWHLYQSVGAIICILCYRELPSFWLFLFFLLLFFFLILLGKLIHVISLWNLWHLTAQALRGTLLWLELTLIAWLVSNTWRKRTSCWDHCQGYGGVWGLLMESGLSQVYRTVLKQSWKVSFGKWCCQLCFLAFFSTLYLAVQRTFGQVFVRCHQFHFRIWILRNALRNLVSIS